MNDDKQEVKENLNKRTDLKRVIIDTPALLNMVKHCREVEAGMAQGQLMGVMRNANHRNADGNLDTENIMNEETLTVTQVLPKTTKQAMSDLQNAMEQEKQKLMDTNEIGFYVNSRIGLAFTS
jgi:hypothetical protein